MSIYTFDIEFFQNDGPYFKRPTVFKNFKKQVPFTDRESYLKWKDEWRAAYKWLSHEIREAKNGRSSKKNPNTYGDAITRALYGRQYACSMMDMRMEAKEISIKMRAERLAAQAHPKSSI